VTLRIAGCLPGFGILSHVGRKSGRTYRIPINVFQRCDYYYFALTYGSAYVALWRKLPPLELAVPVGLGA
jgi:hypothetical protein